MYYTQLYQKELHFTPKKKRTIKKNPPRLNWDVVGLTNSRFIKK